MSFSFDKLRNQEIFNGDLLQKISAVKEEISKINEIIEYLTEHRKILINCSARDEITIRATKMMTEALSGRNTELKHLEEYIKIMKEHDEL